MKDSSGRDVVVGDFIIFKKGIKAQFGIVTEIIEPYRVKLVRAVVKPDKKHRCLMISPSKLTLNINIMSHFFLKGNIEDFQQLNLHMKYWTWHMREYGIPIPPEDFREVMERRMPEILRTWIADFAAMRKFTINPIWTRY